MPETPTQPKGLRDPIWQFIAVPVAIILALAGLAWGYYTFVINRPVKSLSIVVLSSNSLLQAQESIANDTAILYKGQPVRNLSVVTVKIENTGNQAIREAEYAKPIALAFPAGSKVVNAGVTESNPANVGMTVQASQNAATLSQALLNAGDRVIIELVITDLPRDAGSIPFTVDARIVDIKSVVPLSAITEAQSSKSLNTRDLIILVASGVLLGISVNTLFSLAQHQLAWERSRRRRTFHQG